MAKFGIGGKGLEDKDFEDFALLPGWFLASCTNEEANEKGQVELTITITGPTQAGKYKKIFLNDPGLASTEEEAKAQTKRALLHATWLSILTKEEAKQGKDIDWSLALRWKGVIHLENDTYQDKKSGKIIETASFPYRGIFGLGSDSIPPAVRVSLGLPLLPGQTVDGAAAAPKRGKRGAKDAAPPAGSSAQQPPPVDNMDDLLA
jgi:hypothetical protein